MNNSLSGAVRIWQTIGAALLVCAVALGAYGAHGLSEKIDRDLLAAFMTGVHYHFFHTLGLLVVCALAASGSISKKALLVVCYFLFAGVILFSGSLYILAVTGVRWVGALTPIGGLSFMAAWITLGISSMRNKDP